MVPWAKATGGDSQVSLLWKNDPKMYQLCSSIIPYVAMSTAYDKVSERILVAVSETGQVVAFRCNCLSPDPSS